MTPTVPGLGEESGQAGKEKRTGPSDCLELGLEVDRPDTSWLAPSPSLLVQAGMGALSKLGPKRRVGLGVGTASGQRSKKKKKKKSFLVTYFPKLPLAPVPPAWTVPLLPPQHPSSKQQSGAAPPQCDTASPEVLLGSWLWSD